LLQEGTIVAGYRIDGVLGDGGMGVVYRATQLSLEREVALKVLSSDLGDDSGFRIRFQREGQLQAALDHDHIVPVYEAGQSEQGLFLAMRLIDGPTLKDLILARELDPRRSVRLLSQVAHALDAAHAAGLIHRDIKPQNILIGPGDHAYLADFGLIKAPAEAARLTGTGQFIGTIDYVAPEQIQGEPASAASDIYALAGVLYECLTGEVPFPKPNEAATLHAHVIAPPPKVTDLRPELPPAIDDVIARGMAKDPMARPPSATELMLVASRALASAPSIVGPPSGLASAGVSSGGAPGAQATRVRTRPAVSDSGSAPALERAGDGAGAAPATAPREPAASVAAPPEPAAPVAAPPEAPAPAEPADPPRPATAPEAPMVAEPIEEAPQYVEPEPTEPVAAEAARERPSRRRFRWVALAVLAVLAAGAAVAGYLVGHARPRSPLASFTNSAAVNHLQVRYPSSWQLSSGGAVVPGMTFDAPLILTTGSGSLTAGMVADAGGPTLLSPGFRTAVMGALPAAEPLALGATQAYRYRDVAVRGLAAFVTIYVAPTSAGVATIVCRRANRSDPGFQTDCGRIASTLRLIGTFAYPLGPSPAYARRLAATFGQLRASVSVPLAALGSARAPAAQARAARQIAGAYATAADTLARALVSPMARPNQSALVAALRGCANAYASAAAAASSAAAAGQSFTTTAVLARARAAGAYRRANAALTTASTAFSQALQGIRPLGYTLAGQR
jgi:hypothetical protein